MASYGVSSAAEESPRELPRWAGDDEPKVAMWWPPMSPAAGEELAPRMAGDDPPCWFGDDAFSSPEERPRGEDGAWSEDM